MGGCNSRRKQQRLDLEKGESSSKLGGNTGRKVRGGVVVNKGRHLGRCYCAMVQLSAEPDGSDKPTKTRKGRPR